MEDEYIIDSRPFKEWQKVLNQWKHEYTIEILSSIMNTGDLLLIIKRTKNK